MKALIKKYIPRLVFDWYHWALARYASASFGFPSEKLIVVGVTGTNGKTTVSTMIACILEEAGYRVGCATTVGFKVADRERLNDQKMTMLGRTKLQSLLYDMVRAGCNYAVIETSSEGIKQHRHAGIHYDGAVFTNLTPEHLESHGGFENYKAAKEKLFAKLGADPVKVLDGQAIPKVSVVNLDSPHAESFLKYPANKKYGFLVEGDAQSFVKFPLGIVKGLDVHVTPTGSRFTVRGEEFAMHMLGRHNVENALAAIAYGLSQGISLPMMARALAKLDVVPGRLEPISIGAAQDIHVLVDYAPEPESMRRLYEVVPLLHKKRVIHVLGSAGGGRDKDRRPVLGEFAGKGADIVIVTNEDPYDENPADIIEQVAAGARTAGKTDEKDLLCIAERGEALRTAVRLAMPGDLVLVTGKGAEQAICVANGKKIPWDDRVKLRELLAERYGVQANPLDVSGARNADPLPDIDDQDDAHA